ncbi:MAG TPA: hypothetical protein VNZ58_06050 [Thermomicrobiales bacterium]|nr:hypothetical protein [Thermomicrobiales bacterium]
MLNPPENERYPTDRQPDDPHRAKYRENADRGDENTVAKAGKRQFGWQGRQQDTTMCDLYDPTFSQKMVKVKKPPAHSASAAGNCPTPSGSMVLYLRRK